MLKMPADSWTSDFSTLIPYDGKYDNGTDAVYNDVNPKHQKVYCRRHIIPGDYVNLSVLLVFLQTFFFKVVNWPHSVYRKLSLFYIFAACDFHKHL